MVKVLLLFSSGGIGGAERSLTRMALSCNDPSVQYELATTGVEGAWSEWVSSLGATASCYGVFGGRLPSVLRLWRAVVGLRRSRPTIVYAVGIRAYFVATIVRLFRDDIKVVHGIRSTFPKGSRTARNFRIAERLLKHGTSAYVANSEQGAADISSLAGIPRAKMHVIRNGIRFPSGAQPAASRSLTVIVVANITAYKGHLLFLDAIELIVRQVPDVQISLVGRNDLGDALESELNSRGLAKFVRIVGFVPDPMALMAQARVFVLPSQVIEGCPTAILESMALGVPVVAFRIGGIPEIVCDRQDGLLVEPRNSRAMADCVIELLVDTSKNDAMGAEAREKVRRHFTLDVCAQQHARLWRQLASVE